MTNQATAKEMLEKALDAANRSMEYFDWCKEEGINSKMGNYYWANTRELDGKAEAYLDCYRMLTGRKVINIQTAIKEELETMFVF